jgi:DNA polymerase phi
MSCLTNALKGDDRYLQRTAHKAMQSLQKRAEADPKTAGVFLAHLLRGVNFIDFDVVTKSKTVEKLLSVIDDTLHDEVQYGLVDALDECFRRPGTEDHTIANTRRRYVIALQGKLFGHVMSRRETIDCEKELRNPPKLYSSLKILLQWIDAVYFTTEDTDPVISTSTRDSIKGKLATHFEQALKTGKPGQKMLHQVIIHIYVRHRQSNHPTIVEFDSTVQSVVDHGWEILNSIHHSWGAADKRVNSTPFSEGLLLLYCMVMFQVYNGDGEAVEILEDLIAFHRGSATKTTKSDAGSVDDQSDALIEVLLSFASKQSKLLRRMTNTIFEGLAPQVTRNGLQSLVRVLATKESVEGQQEIFDAADEDVDTQDEDLSDVEMIDSDVEVVSSSSRASSESSEDRNDSKDEETEDDGEDEELAAFDAKLAAALGTRKLSNGLDDADDSSTSGASDTDMDDYQMMVLDNKLAEVFRARQQQTNKKREKKDARENIVNFKNRVLDLIEVYLKVEYLASQSLELLLPLLHLARKTKTKQLADRACLILNEFCKRCRGANVPTGNDAVEGIELLLALHVEAGTGASNAHANAASHASILVVKSLVNSGVKIGEIVDVYANSQKRMLTDKKCKIQAGLFTDWNNWCVSARERFAG